MQTLDFFTGQRNSDGRTLDEILDYTDDQLESHHDIIQWCFPLHEASQFNPDAPIVTQEEQRLLSANRAIQQKMRQVLGRWLGFYGFQFQGQQIVPASDFAEKSGRWNQSFNHNHLRITRIIRSLRLFGLDSEARQVYTAFSTFAASSASRINSITPTYWQAALTGSLFAPIKA